MNASWVNGSANETAASAEDDVYVDNVVLATVLLLFSAATVLGNGLVIAAVVRERYLHTATNFFILSLAVADCLVGLVVMPFSALYEVLEKQWVFGLNWCDAWRSLDVLFSTASILNLCVVSLDRYWAITDPLTYPNRMSNKRAVLLIATVWLCSSLISFPAIVWWRLDRQGRPVPDLKCPFTDNLGYLLFSSTISFYLPLFVMVFTYCRIYRAAAVQTRSLKLGSKQVMMGSSELELTLRIHRGGGHGGSGSSQEGGVAGGESSCSRVASKNVRNFSFSRRLAKFAKEKKAAKTLGIVMGVFIVCWLPFFVVNLLSGMCHGCIEHEEIVSAIVTWLGWINSSMNPVIYACWSRDFRRAFARILCVCCPRRVRRRYQATLRPRASQRFSSGRFYSSCALHHASNCQKTYI
ncbi:dopamine receptor 2 [Neocloeon triangulifer]|uniref:dopamine receptor 2 n=1 Tax=Neocloeon triangulifer TaxID=2078957 RepID=UPI00286F70F6|nr:dopamine receptor 2 [Neocloeon triangulifer]